MGRGISDFGFGCKCRGCLRTDLPPEERAILHEREVVLDAEESDAKSKRMRRYWKKRKRDEFNRLAGEAMKRDLRVPETPGAKAFRRRR